MIAKKIDDHAWVGCDFLVTPIIMARKVVTHSSLQQEARNNMDYQLHLIRISGTLLYLSLLHSAAAQYAVTPPYTVSNYVLRYLYTGAHTQTHAYIHMHMHIPFPPPSTMSHLDNTDHLQTTHGLSKLKFFCGESIPCMIAVLSHYFADVLVSSYI